MNRGRLGLIVNPIAGMGGRVGLKGTDGRRALSTARRLGARPEAHMRAVDALREIASTMRGVELLAYPGEMGENEARECGLSPTVVGSLEGVATTADDTRRAAKELVARGVDLLMFAGGDGTARDVCEAIGSRPVVLGIPAGVKMHSGVFALTPRLAGQQAAAYLREGRRRRRVREGEVMDIDEDSFRRGIVSARLYGYLTIPAETRYIQSAKSGGAQGDEEAVRGIAAEINGQMEEGCLYIFGPGTTTREILRELGLRKTLLGVDVVLNRRIIARDVNESELASLIGGRRAKIVVSVIGGQGYILGRGNQQLGPEIVRRVGKDNIIVVATKEKLSALRGRPLLVDTGSGSLDAELGGYWRVTTGLNESVVYRVGA